MSESIDIQGKFITRSGNVIASIESYDDIREIISSRLSSALLSAQEFSGTDSPLSASEFEIRYDQNSDVYHMAGVVHYTNSPENDSWPRYRVIDELVNYLEYVCGVNEQNIKVSSLNDNISISSSSGSTLVIDYDSFDITGASLIIYADIPATSGNITLFDTAMETLKTWVHMHDFAQHTEDCAERIFIDIKRPSPQDDTAYVLWQTLIDYEKWRLEMDYDTLPVVEHTSIDVQKLARALEDKGMTDSQLLLSALQRIATNLLKKDKRVMTEGELINGLLVDVQLDRKY